MMTRRQALKNTAVITAASICPVSIVTAQPSAAPTGPFKLPPLPYPFDALEPHIDAKTMEIHHDKHHAAYVANLNKAIADVPDAANKSVEELLKGLNNLSDKTRIAVRNQGGGHYNHSLFWQMMKKGGGGQPKGELVQALDKSFSNFSGFKEKFTEAAAKVFGSGWAWLVIDNKELRVQSTPNQDSPLSDGFKPLLGLDVWEHAYYLKYQNRRPEYIAAWFNVINWDYVSERYAQQRKA